MPEAESRASEAYRKLEEDIVTLRYRPGDTLTEGKLTEELGMGRTPVREALQRLAWEGLLTIRPRLGVLVAEMNPADFVKVVSARHALEVLLASSAARLASREQRDALKDCAQHMRTSVSNADIMAFQRHDKRFDEIVAEAACNPFAAQAVAPLQTQSRRFWFRYFGEEDLTPAARNHLELMQAIEAGNEKAASEKAESLMTYLRQQALSLLVDGI